jgi:hypothetical protein
MTYSRVTAHAPMLFDDHRNAAYLRAIRELVRPGAVVIDAGAGIGLLGLAVAAAGASHVYLVEPQPVVHCAAEIATASGLADRVTIVQQRIEDTNLPIQADLIISVFTGNLLFSEDLLPGLFRARDRYLKPGGLLLPGRAQLCIAPVTASRLHDGRVARWPTSLLGLDVSSLRRFAANDISLVRGADLQDVQMLAAGAPLCELDLQTAQRAECDARVEFVASTSGMCHGLLCWIRIELAGRWLSSGPGEPEMHWSPAFLPLDPPLHFDAGESVAVRLHRPEHGEWTWWVSARNGSRRHSTFLARAEGAREFERAGRPGH